MIARFLRWLLRLIEPCAIRQENDTMTPALQALADQVAANTAVTASAVLLIKGLSSQIAAAKDDPSAIAALASELHKASDSLAAAVSANTAPPADAAPAAAPDAPAAPAAPVTEPAPVDPAAGG